MKTIYRCSECGEDYKHESPTAEISNIGTVNELIYHLDPCPNCCNDNAECDRIFELEQENKTLKAKLAYALKGPDMDGVGLGAEPSYRHLWDRNNVLEAKLHNIEEGLKRLEAFMMDGPDRSIDPVNREGVAVFALVDGCGECEIHAPTLSLLIDEILTGGK